MSCGDYEEGQLVVYSAHGVGVVKGFDMCCHLSCRVSWSKNRVMANLCWRESNEKEFYVCTEPCVGGPIILR
jgi:hypothetical protein